MYEHRGGTRVRPFDQPGRGGYVIPPLMLIVAYMISAASGGETGDVVGGIAAIVLILGGVIVGLQKLGWLPAGSVAKAAQERADRAEQELTAKNREVEMLTTQLRELEGRTNLQPLLEAQQRTAESIRELAESMRDQSTAFREFVQRSASSERGR